MAYNWTFNLIDKSDIKIIFEIGSRDLLDANTLAQHYDTIVHAFEPNPDCVKICKKNNYDSRVIFNELAVSTQVGPIDFYSFDLNKYNNMGASSIYEIDFVKNRPISDPDYGRTDVQKKISVYSISIDEYCKQNFIIPDMICMDVQECELEVLKSASNILSKVKYIILEASNVPTYKNGCAFYDINTFLIDNNFRHIANNEHQKLNYDINLNLDSKNYSFCDLLYVNQKL
jgi:FkbM family methyltransferase